MSTSHVDVSFRERKREACSIVQGLVQLLGSVVPHLVASIRANTGWRGNEMILSPYYMKVHDHESDCKILDFPRYVSD